MTKYRTIWVSDTHLGSPGCQAERLLDFLRQTESDTLILVGDIIDFWALKRKSYWPESHNTVVQKVLKKARHGTRVIYIPGNHDEYLREYLDHTFGNIEMHPEFIHTRANGETMLCVHGDDFDVVTRYHRWVAVLGDIGYETLLTANRYFNKVRAKFGLGYWSLSAYIKGKVKQAVSFIGEYEENVAKEAKDRGVDGVLCGHIHHAEIKTIDGILYVNTGDWVESCTAIVEQYDGTLELIRWST